MENVTANRGRILTAMGWWSIAVAIIGVLVTLAGDLPTGIAFVWTMWGLLISVLMAATGVWLVVWGRRVRRRVTTDSN